jgi:hypothetical protein
LAGDNGIVGIEQQLGQIACVGRRPAPKTRHDALNDEIRRYLTVPVPPGAIGQHETPETSLLPNRHTIFIHQARTDVTSQGDLHYKRLH